MNLKTNSFNHDKYIVILAFFTALTVSLYVLDNFIPKPLPFLKLGFANLIIVFLIFNYYFKEALIISLSKIFLGGFLTGTLFSPTTLLSLTGTTFALVMMIFIRSIPIDFSILGMSVIGAVFHNFGQLIMIRMILIKQNSIFYLIPVLTILGIITGLITGYLADKFKGIFKTINRKISKGIT